MESSYNGAGKKEFNQEDNKFYCAENDTTVGSQDSTVNSSLEFFWNMQENEGRADARVPKNKRKRVVATIYDKLQILKELEEGRSIKYLSKKYGLGVTTIHDVQKKKDKIRRYSICASDSIFGIRNRRTMRESPFIALDKALLHWFRQERAAERPVSGPQCCERARQLFPILGLEGSFDASAGWLSRWKDRHGIRCIGNTLDFIKWPEGPLEEHIFVSSKHRGGDQEIKSEKQSLSEANYLINDGSESFPDNMKQDKDKTSDCIVPPNSCNEATESTFASKPCPGTNKMSIDDLIFLRFLIKKLENIAYKFENKSKQDSHDEFGKYISSLIRKLPPVKVIPLKQKLVSEVLDVVLAHEKGLPDPLIVSDIEAEPQSAINEIKRCEGRLSLNAISAMGTAAEKSPSKNTNANSNRNQETQFLSKKTVSHSPDGSLLDQSLPERNTMTITTKSGRKVKPPKLIIIEEPYPTKRLKKMSPRKGTYTGKAKRKNYHQPNKKTSKDGADDNRFEHAERDMDIEEKHQLGDIKAEIDYATSNDIADAIDPELTEIKQEVSDYDEFQAATSCEAILDVSHRLIPSASAQSDWNIFSSSQHRKAQCTGVDVCVPTTSSDKKVHWLTKKGGNDAHIRHRCIICYQKHKSTVTPEEAVEITKQVITFCKDCSGNPYMCIDCFNETHIGIQTMYSC